MSIKALYYCRPRILILCLLLSIFSFFNFLYWLQYVSALSNISSLIFCLGSILSLIGTSILFMLHSVPFINEKSKRISGIFILFGGILWFIASCFELSIDNHYCGNYYFCTIHVIAYILLPFGTSIIIAMDEFFDDYFYYNQRLRITTFSLLLLLSSMLFVPYYLEINKFNKDGLKIHDKQQLEDSTNLKIKDIDIYVEFAFVIVWAAIGLSSALMALCIGYCKLHEDKTKKNILSWISSVLLCAGSAILVLSYIVQNDESNTEKSIIAATVNKTKFDIDDPIICYHFLVCAEAWIIAIDAIRGNKYKPIKSEFHEKKAKRKNRKYKHALDYDNSDFDEYEHGYDYNYQDVPVPMQKFEKIRLSKIHIDS